MAFSRRMCCSQKCNHKLPRIFGIIRLPPRLQPKLCGNGCGKPVVQNRGNAANRFCSMECYDEFRLKSTFKCIRCKDIQWLKECKCFRHDIISHRYYANRIRSVRKYYTPRIHDYAPRHHHSGVRPLRYIIKGSKSETMKRVRQQVLSYYYRGRFIKPEKCQLQLDPLCKKSPMPPTKLCPMDFDFKRGPSMTLDELLAQFPWACYRCYVRHEESV